MSECMTPRCTCGENQKHLGQKGEIDIEIKIKIKYVCQTVNKGKGELFY